MSVGARKFVYWDMWLGDGKVTVSEARVDSMKNFRRPVTKKDTRCF